MEDKYYHTEESVKEYIELAKDVDASGPIKKLLEFKSSGMLLELGSGPGTDWKLLSEHFTVTGSDLSEEFFKHLKSQHPDGDFIIVDAVTLEVSKTYDCIFSNKVLHHVSDEDLIDSIQRQHKILNEGGLICHSFWKGEGSEEFKGMLVNYQNVDSLKKMFGDNFKILMLEDYKEFEESDSLLLIGRKI